MANRIAGASSSQAYQEGFFEAVRDGNLCLVKNKWKELKNDPASHDLSEILVRAGESYWDNSQVEDEQKYQLALWIRAKEAKLEGRENHKGECEDLSYLAVNRGLFSAVSRLHWNDFYIAIDQIKKFQAENRLLVPNFFRSEWKSAQKIVAECNGLKKGAFLKILRDALKRIDSKETLFLVARRLRSLDFEPLPEKVEKIYKDQAALFPFSSRTIASDWQAAKDCIDSNLNSERRERAISIISTAEKRLQQGWDPYYPRSRDPRFDDMDDVESGFYYDEWLAKKNF